jgi:hypothetical protein
MTLQSKCTASPQTRSGRAFMTNLVAECAFICYSIGLLFQVVQTRCKRSSDVDGLGSGMPLKKTALECLNERGKGFSFKPMSGGQCFSRIQMARMAEGVLGLCWWASTPIACPKSLHKTAVAAGTHEDAAGKRDHVPGKPPSNSDVKCQDKPIASGSSGSG